MYMKQMETSILFLKSKSRSLAVQYLQIYPRELTGVCYDVQTFQSFFKRLQKSFKLHFLHRSQHISCIQGFPLGLHGKVVCTITWQINNIEETFNHQRPKQSLPIKTSTDLKCKITCETQTVSLPWNISGKRKIFNFSAASQITDACFCVQLLYIFFFLKSDNLWI